MLGAGAQKVKEQEVRIPADDLTLEGSLSMPKEAAGIVIFAHGSGSSRQSPRNQSVARALLGGGLATLLFDLLTRDEEALDMRTGHLRFDIGLLARRLLSVTDWLAGWMGARQLRIGYFGASTGAGAALVAAARAGDKIGAVVSRGGRPDLAGPALALVQSPTLLIVGGDDREVIELNRMAYEQMRCEKDLKIIPGASHLFEEAGTLEEVARLAAAWFQKHFTPPLERPAGL